MLQNLWYSVFPQHTFSCHLKTVDARTHTKNALRCHSDQDLNRSQVNSSMTTQNPCTQMMQLLSWETGNKKACNCIKITLHLDYVWTIILLLPYQQTVAEVKRFNWVDWQACFFCMAFFCQLHTCTFLCIVLHGHLPGIFAVTSYLPCHAMPCHVIRVHTCNHKHHAYFLSRSSRVPSSTDRSHVVHSNNKLLHAA